MGTFVSPGCKSYSALPVAARLRAPLGGMAGMIGGGMSHAAARGVAATKKVRKAGKAGRGRRWTAGVTERSDALDLASGVFRRDDPQSIARSLKRSAERSRRRKAEPYRSAMSMLTFYINRAGNSLPAGRRRVLEQAKDELRALFGRKRRG